MRVTLTISIYSIYEGRKSERKTLALKQNGLMSFVALAKNDTCGHVALMEAMSVMAVTS